MWEVSIRLDIKHWMAMGALQNRLINKAEALGENKNEWLRISAVDASKINVIYDERDWLINLN